MPCTACSMQNAHSRLMVHFLLSSVALCAVVHGGCPWFVVIGFVFCCVFFIPCLVLLSPAYRSYYSRILENRRFQRNIQSSELVLCIFPLAKTVAQRKRNPTLIENYLNAVQKLHVTKWLTTQQCRQMCTHTRTHTCGRTSHTESQTHRQVQAYLEAVIYVVQIRFYVHQSAHQHTHMPTEQMPFGSHTANIICFYALVFFPSFLPSFSHSLPLDLPLICYFHQLFVSKITMKTPIRSNLLTIRLYKMPCVSHTCSYSSSSSSSSFFMHYKIKKHAPL